MEHSNKKTTDLLLGLEILRFSAAVAVVLTHLDFPLTLFGLDLGSFGVSLFFIISGFVIVLSTSKPMTAQTYFSKRIARIVPAYWAVTFLVLLSAAIFPQALNTVPQSFPQILKSLFFIAFEKEPGRVQPILFVGWTLNLEMFFYFLFGISLSINKKHSTWMTCVTLGSLILVGHLVNLGPVGNFYLQPLWMYFIFGMALSKLYSSHLLNWTPSIHKSATFGALITAIICHYFSLPEIGLTCLALAGISASKAFTLPTQFAYMGALTYALYLTHPIAVNLARNVLKIALPEPTNTILITAVSIVIAIVFYHLIDKPASKWLGVKLKQLEQKNRGEPKPTAPSGDESTVPHPPV